MNPANDTKIDYRQLVRDGYDACARRYAAARRDETEPLLDELLGRLAPGSSVLDIGCGSGVPVARRLAQSHRVTGVDLSPAMIALARANVPSATFYCADILEADLPPGRFDAIVSFYALFHLPREKHRELFQRIHGWLRPGGHVMATVGRYDEAAYTEDDFFGVTMYWSNWGEAHYRRMLREIGFEIVLARETGHGYEPEAELPEESHPVLLAHKPAQC